MLDGAAFVALAALWGASFLFMRVAAPEFGPLTLMLLRCGIGALTLLPIVLWRGDVPALRNALQHSALVGVINSAIPFALLAFAALSLTTGTLSILNGTAPFWGALVGVIWLRDKLTNVQIAGLFIGFAGVLLLAAGGPGDAAASGGAVALAVLAALAATLAYGVAANWTKRHLPSSNALANATGSQLGATAALLAPGLWWWPAQAPSAIAWLAVVLLGIFSTGFAYILYFRLIRNVGPTRAITVTFAIPVFGMFFGWLLLDEQVSALMVAGAAVVIVGCAMTLGLINRKA